MLYTDNFDDKIKVDFPCEMLVYDVCYGTTYCGCQNGFWRETLKLKEVGMVVKNSNREVK